MGSSRPAQTQDLHKLIIEDGKRVVVDRYARRHVTHDGLPVSFFGFAVHETEHSVSSRTTLLFAKLKSASARASSMARSASAKRDTRPTMKYGRETYRFGKCFSIASGSM